jgi:hypothetical protein
MNSRPKTHIALFALALLAAVFLFACETLPPEMLKTSAQYENAKEAIAPGADVFIAFNPPKMPLFSQTLIKSLSPNQAGTLDSILGKTACLFAGLEQNHGESGAGFNYTAVAVGRYPSQQYKTALSLQKGIKNNGRWVETKSQKIAFPSSQAILVTNADMQGFLDRFTFPDTRPERKNRERHPISTVDSILSSNPTAGLVAYLPNPITAQIPILSSEDASLPLKSLTLLVFETPSAESIELRFQFDSENAARVYLSSVRMLSAGIKLSLSLSGTPALSRNATTVSVTGLSATRQGLVQRLKPLYANQSPAYN